MQVTGGRELNLDGVEKKGRLYRRKNNSSLKGILGRNELETNRSKGPARAQSLSLTDNDGQKEIEK